ncbi:bis(5'-nucleosyl)-tetraphosphatase PrpE [Falsibacillus albus]|uniref:Bis(5'-nucleosyl)-tetraphosphatase PrpE [asymmetrical] n=1 Tax=Falsibacillus albus TaxID=2478915 RepID=A0A3L7K519_9BACI|nr:bis(5'-nucleosyl)-tetraphosphatase PrpE [Falsibacillus albus]RLQ97171.1 bis(5'-nucleosyl)-tetraphosphatase PrpE [Falsibacillus albus]
MKIDIIGDIHGCMKEFETLTEQMGYKWEKDLPVHEDDRLLGFVGDLTDRGPDSLEVIQTVWKLWKKGQALFAPGNHCNKLYRYLNGNNVQITHGLETTVAEFDALTISNRNDIAAMFMELYEESPLYHVLDNGKLIIAHAGIKEDDIGKYSKKVKTFVLYGDITGEKHPDGSPVRRDWAKHYQGSAWIVYGHTPVKEARLINRTINIDTGAVFGGSLTSVRYPEMNLYNVPSSMPYVKEKFRTFD